MSKFVEKLKRGIQTTPVPMGFARASSQEKPRMLLIAEIANTSLKKLAEYTEGADAGLLEIDNLNSGLESLPQLARIATDIPWGGWLKDGSWEKSDSPVFDTDFIVFPPGMPLFTLPATLGKLMEIDTSIADSLLRTIEDLPVDAILVGNKLEKLSWQSIAMIQRIYNMQSKPIIIRVQADISAVEMETLWSAGASGVVVDVGDGPVTRMKQLREAIDKANFLLPRKSKKIEVTLPFVSPGVPAKAEEEEEEEEE